MRAVKFLHCSDIHLDMPFTSLGAQSDRSTIRRQDLKETFQRIMQIAREEKVDIILISGDLYEQNYVKKSTINFVNDCFSEIPHINVFIVPGNHDPYIADSYYKNFKWCKNVHILTANKPYVILEEINTCVYGVGFTGFYEEKNLIHGLEAVNPGLVNILLVHGTVDMDFKQEAYNPMSSGSLASLGMDYIALGHFHNRIDNIGGCNIYNPGSPEPLGFDETGEHGVFVGSVMKTGDRDAKLDIRFIRTNKRFYENVEVNVDGCNTDEQICRKILAVIGDRDVNNGLFNITLKGFVERGFKANAAQIQLFLNDRIFFVRLKDETAPDYDFAEIRKEPGLRGLFTRKIFSLIAKTEDEHEKKILMKALYYGIEALEQGRIEGL